ncbi:hypothetical protein BDW66DRAFT_157406 [Aspergillus desertorum]
MPPATYAVLGASGNTRIALIQNLLSSPSPGSVTDLSLIAACIRNTRAVFLAVTSNDNIPRLRLSQDSSADSPAEADPSLLRNDRSTPKSQTLSWVLPIMKTAASNVCADLIKAEQMLRASESWVTSIFIKPAGLSESFISYLDLAAAMLEAADEPDGRYDGRNSTPVNIVSTKLGRSIYAQTPSPQALSLANRLLQQNHEHLSDKTYLESQITKIDQYTNLLRFSEGEINHQGSWKDVVNEYPGIVAETLAQAAAHDSFGTDYFFFTAEKRAAERNGQGETLSLIGTMKMEKPILVNAADEILNIASRFQVTEQTLARKTAEMLNLCAYIAGAAQRTKDGYEPKIDFFFMHCVTSNIFSSVLGRQDWISVRGKVRLVEWKGRLDLMWYAVCGDPELNVEPVRSYKGERTGDMSSEELFAVVNEQHDDGQVVMFAVEDGEEFMVKGDMWLRFARMAYEATIETNMQNRWVVMVGMDGAWKNFRALSSA